MTNQMTAFELGQEAYLDSFIPRKITKNPFNFVEQNMDYLRWQSGFAAKALELYFSDGKHWR